MPLPISLLLLTAVVRTDGKAPAVPSFKGPLSIRRAAFKRFVVAHQGRAVRLLIQFDDERRPWNPRRVYEPYGYKGNESFPEFDVGDWKFRLRGVPSGTNWRRYLPYEPVKRRLSGLYRVAKVHGSGGGKWFDLSFLRR